MYSLILAQPVTFSSSSPANFLQFNLRIADTMFCIIKLHKTNRIVESN